MTNIPSAPVRSAESPSARVPPRPVADDTSAFRPEIQALRAVAVLLVVAYHLDARVLPGGFVGVDIFFVISGYLMTRRLVGEMRRTGAIRIGRFYAGRIRRLLPAALTVLALTLLVVALIVPVNLWSQYGRQIAASALYVENWTLAVDAVDYSAPTAESSPVQHFWSLAVEEQFYLLWPLLLLLVWKASAALRVRADRALTVTITAVVATSFATGLIWTAIASDAAYFATPTRIWELALGGLVWLIGRTALPAAGLWALGWLGALAALSGAFLYSSTTPYPGVAALLPCLGTAAVILAGAQRSRFSVSTVSRFRPAQYIGDISYSLYLWHWPLIVLVPIVLSNQFHAPQKAAVGIAAVVLAAITKTLLEDRFRRGPGGTAPTRGRVGLAMLLGASLVIAACGLALSSTGRSRVDNAVAETAAARLALPADAGAHAVSGSQDIDVDALVPRPLAARQDVLDHDAAGDDCLATGASRKVATCRFGPADGELKVVLVGDSHAAQWLPAVAELSRAHDWQLTTMLRTGCPLSLTYTTRAQELGGACVHWIDSALDRLEQSDYDLMITSAYSGTGWATDGIDGAARGMAAAWDRVSATGTQVAVVRDTPIPEAAGVGDVPSCLAAHRVAPKACAPSRSSGLLADPQVRAVEQAQSAHLIDPTPAFCKGSRCSPAIGGVLVYRDGNHITRTFAETSDDLLFTALRSSGVLADARRP